MRGRPILVWTIVGLTFLIVSNLLKSAATVTKEIVYFNQDTKQFLGSIPKVRQKNETISTAREQRTFERPVEIHDYPFEFAACLLTKDDKIILPEWLAYHYTVLPLRYLIVAVDPLSLTSPEPILDLYRNYTNLKIETWTGNWYWKIRYWKHPDLSMRPPTTDHLIIEVKRQRQRAFYGYCLQRLKLLNHTWTALIDTDEYFTYNSVMPAEVKGGKAIQGDVSLSIEHRKQLPGTIGKQNETFAHWIRQYGADHAGISENTFCAVYPRLQFFSKYVQNISNPFGLASKTANNPSKKCYSFDREAFHTLQYTAHDKLKGSFQGPLVLPSKALINAALMKAEYKVRNPHVPFKLWQCKGGTAQVKIGEGWPFRVHQYSGSLKTFLSRPERTVKMWEQRNQRNFVDNYDLSLTRWFPEFVKLLDDDGNGLELAYRLTQQAHDDAYDESMGLKHRITVLNESVSPIYEWERPMPDKEKPARLHEGISTNKGTSIQMATTT